MFLNVDPCICSLVSVWYGMRVENYSILFVQCTDTELQQIIIIIIRVVETTEPHFVLLGELLGWAHYLLHSTHGIVSLTLLGIMNCQRIKGGVGSGLVNKIHLVGVYHSIDLQC